MFRTPWSLKSNEHRAWFLCRMMFREVDESSYEKVRHQLSNCVGIETKVKLTKKGWTSGGGRRMPLDFYPINTVDAIEQDKIFDNVLLCKFCRAQTDYGYEIIAYKFCDAKTTLHFQKRFQALKPTGGSTTRGTASSRSIPGARPSATNSGLLPGRPCTFAVGGGSLAPDRWGARDRITPRLFTSKSLEDLLGSSEMEESAESSGRPPLLSVRDDDDVVQDELPDADKDADVEDIAFGPSVIGRRRHTFGSVLSLDDHDVSWLPPSRTEASRRKVCDVGLTVRFPAATDPKARPITMECTCVDGVRRREVACQVDLPRKNRIQAEASATAAKVNSIQHPDDDDVVADEDDFSWDFGDEDEHNKVDDVRALTEHSIIEQISVGCVIIEARPDRPNNESEVDRAPVCSTLSAPVIGNSYDVYDEISMVGDSRVSSYSTDVTSNADPRVSAYSTESCVTSSAVNCHDFDNMSQLAADNHSDNSTRPTLFGATDIVRDSGTESLLDVGLRTSYDQDSVTDSRPMSLVSYCSDVPGCHDNVLSTEDMREMTTNGNHTGEHTLGDNVSLATDSFSIYSTMESVTDAGSTYCGNEDVEMDSQAVSSPDWAYISNAKVYTDNMTSDGLNNNHLDNKQTEPDSCDDDPLPEPPEWTTNL